MPRMSGGHAVVKALRGQGVTTLFALPGVQNDPLFNALYDEGDAIHVIHPRHEQGAAYMAYGYAQSTGRVGAYAVVPGPGVLNTSAALSTAYAANAPVLCLSGQIRSDFIGRGLRIPHEIPDQLGILRSLTKWAARINHPAEIGAIFAEAFRQALSGRRRPVAIELPTDVLAQVTEVLPPVPPAGPDPGPPIDTELVEQAARVLGAAERPVIVVGGGAMDAGAGLAAIAELLQAPIIVGQTGKGAVSDRHPAVVPHAVGHRFWAKADAVLAVGTRLTIQQIVWGTDSKMPIVRIDADPHELDLIAKPAVGMVADASEGLAALISALPRHNRKRSRLDAEIAGARDAFARRIESAVGPQKGWLDAIRAELPEDGIFVDELTQIAYCARFAFPVTQPRTFITSAYQGTLGYGFPTALGAQVAYPERKVLSVCGDGGFLFAVQELATAVLHEIPLVTIVFNDNAYGNVLRAQEQVHGGRVIATRLHNPDFAAMTKTFGANGLRATSPGELRRALREGFATRAPTVIEVPVGEFSSPWPFIHLPRVRGGN